jgi:hypothetical protein
METMLKIEMPLRVLEFLSLSIKNFLADPCGDTGFDEIDWLLRDYRKNFLFSYKRLSKSLLVTSSILMVGP